MQSNVGKFRDSTPELAPAGKVFDQGGTASECIHGRGPEPPVPAVVGKFSNTDVGRPPCGEARIHHGRANDEDLASLFYHGVSTSGSARASELVSPAFQSRFKAAMDKKKEGLYLSKKERPLGEIRTINASYMPDTVDRLATTFGKPTVFDGTAGECVNPDKSAADIASDADKYHDMYATSHHDFRVGEAYDRKKSPAKVIFEVTYAI